MKRLIYRIFVWACLSLVLLLSGSLCHALVLDVPEVSQEQTNWCWAGCCQATISYYRGGENVPEQCDIANYARTNNGWGEDDCCLNPGGAICNQTNWMYGTGGSFQAILQNWEVDNTARSYALSQATVTSETDAGRPFEIRWGWDAGGGHFLVGRGIDGNTVYYMDPWPGNGYSTADYNWVVSGGGHTWTHSLQLLPQMRCMDFEDGVDAAPIRSTIPGMTFTTTQGFDWIYGDKTTGKYNVYPYGSGAYVCNGNVFAWLGPNQGMGRIDFTGATARKISLWTSNAYGLWLEAFDENGSLLDSDHAPSNLWTHQLSQISVSAPSIAYVLVHDEGNYWLIDDLCVEDLLAEAGGFLPEGVEPAMEILDVINQGASATQFFNNPALGTLYIILHWFGSEMKLTIYKPDGSLLGEWQTDVPPIMVTIPNAQPGNWRFDITAVDVPEDHYPYALVIGAATAPLDMTPPVVVIGSPIDGKSYFNSSPVRFTFSAEDMESGISELNALLDGVVPVQEGQDTLLTRLGSHTLRVIAVNGVGLADTAWASFSINNFRWLKPITYHDSLNTEIIDVRENSTLPIKFTVFDSSGAFVADTTVRVVIEGTQVDFRYGRCDTCVRIDRTDPRAPKYIANLHTNFKHWDYGISLGTEYWIKTFLSEVLAHKARVVVLPPPRNNSKMANIPENFTLSQNHPNPFNPTCEIGYALPTDCHVKLSIYNVLAQRVRVLVDEYQDAGNKSVMWDGKDEQGQDVTSGIYFYRIEAGDFSQSKKMVLLR